MTAEVPTVVVLFSEMLLTKVTSKMWRVLPHRGYLVVLNSLLSTTYTCELFPHRTVSYLWYHKMLNIVIFMRPHKNQHFTHQISSLDRVCNIFKSAHGYYMFILNFSHLLLHLYLILIIVYSLRNQIKQKAVKWTT